MDPLQRQDVSNGNQSTDLPMRSTLCLLFVATIALNPGTAVSAPQNGQEAGYRAGDARSIRIPGSDVAFELVHIPEGAFHMGSPPQESGRDEDEGPQRRVHVSAFWMGRFEVSGDEFALFRFRDRDTDSTAIQGAPFSVDAVSRPSTPYEDPSFGMGSSRTPATGMTQWAALQYARWLTAKTGVFFRLPTEAEWEYACLAGTEGPFSVDRGALDNAAWHRGNSDGKLQPVGQRAPNEWGLFDLHGNASEWTLDQYRPDAHSSVEEDTSDPWTKPTRRHPRTVRGGSFRDEIPALRCANRVESSMDWKRRDPQIPQSEWWNTDSPFLGFRLVSPVVQPSPEEQDAFWRLVLGE